MNTYTCTFIQFQSEDIKMNYTATVKSSEAWIGIQNNAKE